MADMVILQGRFPNRAALQVAWDATCPHGGLFVRTTRPLVPGDPVVVELCGRALPEHLYLRATVRSVRASAPRPGMRAGVTVAFDADERGAVDYIQGLLRAGTRPARSRQSPRLPVSVRASVRLESSAEARAATTINLSTGGLLLAMSEPPPPDTRLVVSMPIPGALAPLELDAVVVHTSVVQGRAGLRFAWHGVNGVRRVREALRRLKAA